jgi:hypothetical protein
MFTILESLPRNDMICTGNSRGKKLFKEVSSTKCKIIVLGNFLIIIIVRGSGFQAGSAVPAFVRQS